MANATATDQHTLRINENPHHGAHIRVGINFLIKFISDGKVTRSGEFLFH